jgi:histone acetyltransferase
MHLNDAKNIFSNQLPNMGGEYISRLVFDFHALTVMILHDGRVTSGVCARVFPSAEESFIEIVFMAVLSIHQMCGYGRLVMNSLKTFIQGQELYDLLTCADNDAVGFFRKQGFNDKAIHMDPNRWVGRIKDYDKITLMHCHIWPEVDYLHFQRTLDEEIRFAESHLGKRFHQGLFDLADIWLPFPQAPTYLNIPLPEVMRLTDVGDPRPEDQRLIAEYPEKMKEIRDKAMLILQQLQSEERFFDIFQKPVTESIAPQYFSTITRPMDFQTIERRLRRFKDYYKRPEIFGGDIEQMVENCKQFNSSETIYHKTAVNLRTKFRQLYAQEFPESPIEK